MTDRASTAETGSEIGSSQQVALKQEQHEIPATVGAGDTVTSALLFGAGYQKVVAALTLSQNGVLTIQRYLDDEGTIPLALGAADTIDLVANQGAVLYSVDGVPYRSLKISVQNTGGVTGNISDVAVLFQSQ